VFQGTEVGVKEVRGFSFGDMPLPVIVVNRKDAPQAKIFSMLHELTHISLNSPGLCNLIETENHSPSAGQPIEVFCNRLAAEILMPRDEFLAEDIVMRIRDNLSWDDDDILDLARRFNASREAIVRRLLTLNLVDESFYQQKRAEYHAEIRKPRRGGGFASQASLSISANGKPYTRLVIDAYSSNRITSRDVSSYLSIKLKYLKQIGETVGIG
jgi:Zn-dependent peptidase ImmA (M78 family)